MECKEGVARLEFHLSLRTLKLNKLMINNSSLQKWNRLEQKQPNRQFINEIIQGMQCSPFEAKAILNTVHKVFKTCFQDSPYPKPGQLQLVCVSADNSPKLKLSECRMVTVTLTLDNGQDDLKVRKKYGIIGLRQHRLQRVCVEAFQQEGVLTVEDLAYRLFNCGIRTINRDLKAFKKQDVVLPLRSIIKDMGRSISHRPLIVKHWLMGKEYSQIARATHHSIEAVQNYISKFKRVVSLSKDNFDIHTIAFLIRMSPDLVQKYFQLYQNQEMAEHRKQELETLLKKTTLTTIQNQMCQ